VVRYSKKVIDVVTAAGKIVIEDKLTPYKKGAYKNAKCTSIAGKIKGKKGL